MRNDIRQYARVLVDALKDASEKEASEKAERFKKMLYKQGAFKKVGDILMSFSRVWKERGGTVATVVSATPLSSQTKNSMKKILKDRNYMLEEEINPSVIGGVALQLGNEYLIDGTIKGKLKKIQKIIN